MKLPAGFTLPDRTITEQDRKGLCSQAGKELVWTKTSRQSMVSTFKEELTEIRIQTKQT